jgi:hypothetical protein
MSASRSNYDVFLSCSLVDRSAAEEVAEALRNAGLRVFRSVEVAEGTSYSAAIRHALAVSDALVLVLPPEGALRANTAIEVGAAMAWGKPICIVQPDNGHVRSPGYLSDYPVYPISRVDDVVQAVKRGKRPLSATDLAALEKLYVDMGVPTDHFIRDPVMLDELAEQFRGRTGSDLEGERLLYEMIRRRKSGKWPRLTKKRQKTGQKTA